MWGLYAKHLLITDFVVCLQVTEKVPFRIKEFEWIKGLVNRGTVAIIKIKL